jgi:hypothetical protein
MSNNKQSMKLYTEEQVIDIFEKYGNMSAINARNIIDLSESIELPSDEEIQKLSWIYTFNKFGEVDDFIDAQDGFEDGLRWMRDKIGGNKC